MSHWVAMHCTPEREELQGRHPAAWLLLCQIATRAKYRDCPLSGMRFGEAFLGDYKKAGLPSEGHYRSAKRTLERAGLVTFRRHPLGTTATLVNTTLFSLTDPTANDRGTDRVTDEERTASDPTTTNTPRHRDTVTQREDADSSSFSLCSPAVKKKRKKQSPETMPEEMQRLMESAPPQSRLRHGEAARVAREWRAIPAGDRPGEETLQLAMERWKASARWVNEGGRYIMALHRWVRERCWRELPAPPTAAPVAAAVPKFIPSFPGERPPKNP